MTGAEATTTLTASGVVLKLRTLGMSPAVKTVPVTKMKTLLLAMGNRYGGYFLYL